MCSIWGALGHPDLSIMSKLQEAARDRGRDAISSESYQLMDGRMAILGNCRATPTTEIEQGRPQPYEGVVHNGTIANDRELGGKPGEIDSEVLPRVLDRQSAFKLAQSLEKVKGSFALGVVAPDTLYLACNYKPVYYWGTGNDTVYFSSMERHFDDIVPCTQRPMKLEPYTVIDLSTMYSVRLKQQWTNKAVVIASSGLDSTTAAWVLKARGYEVTLLHFVYGCQAEGREAEHIKAIATEGGFKWAFIPLDFKAFAGSSTLLKPDGKIVGGMEGAEYAHEWVPARNTVMIALAVAWAESHGHHVVALGNNLEESGAYPDNEEELTNLLNQAAPMMTQNGYRVDITSPVGNLMKHEIVALGLRLGVPYRYTWSCYKGGSVHCGKCGPCFMRLTAFKRNGTVDPAEYEPETAGSRPDLKPAGGSGPIGGAAG